MTKCIFCGKDLPKSNRHKDGGTFTRSMSIGNIDPDVLFCTLRCAAKYGVAIAKQAYPERVSGGEK